MNPLQDKNQQLINNPITTEEIQFTWFKKKILTLTKIDLESYKSRQMKRRLCYIMEQNGAKNFTEYYKILESDTKKLEEFKNFITINVSVLFRDKEKFERLEKTVIPNLLKRNLNLKVWSAGCSYGAEPYSVAMLLLDIAPFSRFKIFASDIDVEILKKAKTGIFTKEDVKNVPPNYLTKYFTYDNVSGLYALKETVKSKVAFRQHNLLEKFFDSNFDLIMCRNVVIYFTEDTKAILYKKFQEVLAEKGILFIGSTEIIFNSEKLGLRNIELGFYEKV